ncbi:MAG: helix-turn-helix transcriptional regulator [Clostridiales bacterium]|nr:helix-turn-helix transcriptional regulator [Clostridiales bacterium]MDY4655868.1 helix-turn-helix transcriptional regulator [Eubacteriales bacterium]
MNKFSLRLKELRLEKGISQKKLSEIIGTNNSSICD